MPDVLFFQISVSVPSGTTLHLLPHAEVGRGCQEYQMEIDIRQQE
jgi:hypothetical protein